MTNKNSIRIASYNLLHSIENLEERYSSLKEEIQSLNPDVIGFQESFNTGWDLLVEHMESLGYHYFYKSFNCELLYDPANPKFTGNSIFSKYPLRNESTIKFPEVTENIPVYKVPDAISAEVVLPDGSHFLFLVHHAVWRAENEKYRYWQAEVLNNYAVTYPNKGSFVALVGDFNAFETGYTMKYFKGEAPDRKGDFAYWVDAYTHKGKLEDYATSSPKLYWARDTAKRTGIVYPEELPERRIDYILVNGWVYGRAGSPLTFGRVGTNLKGAAEPTDHYGIYSDLLLV